MVATTSYTTGCPEPSSVTAEQPRTELSRQTEASTPGN